MKLCNGLKVTSIVLCLCCMCIILIGIVVLGCTSDTTKVQLGSLKGQVVLYNDTANPSFDPIDFSGVTIALYELAKIDTTITRLNNKHPEIGVCINQDLEFDHRLQNPVVVVQTDNDGLFTFKCIPIGVYNLVALKQGWGYKYICNVTIGANNVNTGIDGLLFDNECLLDSIVLYPEFTLNGYVDQGMVFEKDHIYVIEDYVTIVSDVEVCGGAVFLLQENSRLIFHGNVIHTREEDYIKFSSYSCVYSVCKERNTDLMFYDKVSFAGNHDYHLSKLLFEYSQNGLTVGGNIATLSNIILRNNKSLGLSAESNNTTVSNALIYNNEQKGIYSASDIEILRSVVLNNEEAIHLPQASTQIKNNYFINNKFAIRLLMGEHTISNNCFDGNDYAVSVCGSDPIISYNNFYKNEFDIETNYYWGVARLYSNPIVEYNNFYSSRFYVYLYGKNSFYLVATGEGVNKDQVYPNNYLKATDIQNHIFDCNYPNSELLYSVSFVPRKYNVISGAGIRIR